MTNSQSTVPVARDRARHSSALVTLAVLCLIALLIGGGWYGLGRFTVSTRAWSNSSAYPSRDSLEGWYHPSRVILVAGDAAMRRLAERLGEELVARGVFASSLVIDELPIPYQAGDFVFTLTRTAKSTKRSMLRWERTVTIGMAGGTDVMTEGQSSSAVWTGGTRHVAIDEDWDVTARGMGMAIDPLREADDVARRIATDIQSAIPDQPNPRFTEMPASCIGQLGEVPTLAAISPYDAVLVAHGSALFADQLAWWRLHDDRTPEHAMEEFEHAMVADGWRRYRSRHDEDNRTFEMAFSRDGERAVLTRLDSDRAGHGMDNGFQQFAVGYMRLFDATRRSLAIDALWDSGAPIEQLLTFEHLMDKRQTARLVQQLEAAPQPTPQWHRKMAGRYWYGLHDRVRAEQALRQAYALAVSDRDLEYIHTAIPRLARELGVTDLAEPMTGQAMQDAGAINLSSGHGAFTLAEGERGVGYINPGKDVLLVTFRCSAGNLRLSTYSAPVHRGTEFAYEPNKDYHLAYREWQLTYTTTRRDSGGIHIDLRITRGER